MENKKNSEDKTEKAKKQPKAKKSSFFKGSKFKHGGMATAFTAIFVAIVIVINILFSLLTQRFPSMNLDMTAEGLNTLSEDALEVAKSVENPTQIYITTDEDTARSDSLFSSYGVKFSQIANLSDKLCEANSNISLTFIDPDTNPEFMSQYAEEGLANNNVLVKTDKRTKILTINDLFGYSQDPNTSEVSYYSTVDSALANAISLVNLDSIPKFVILTGHEEMLSSDVRTGFESLLGSINFEVTELNPLTEDIPSDAQMVMIPTPTTDYTDEEIQKLRDYLSITDGISRTVMVTTYPTQAELPKLAGFLEEWGVSVATGVSVAETDTGRIYANNNPGMISVDASSDILSDNTYSTLLSPISNPITTLFETNDDVVVYKLWTTADTAYLQSTEDTSGSSSSETSEQTVATLSRKLLNKDNSVYYQSVAVFGSSIQFADGYGLMSTNTFGNRAYMTDLLRELTDTGDSSNSAVYTQQVETNSADISASGFTIVMWGLFVFTIAVPLLVLIAGLVVFLKRRHL